MINQCSKSPEDIFFLPVGDGNYFLYAPLRRVLSVINNAAVIAVYAFLEGGFDALNVDQKKVIDNLKASGLFTEPFPEPPVFPSDYEFKPYEVILFPTSRCNLRCTYCYADAGRRNTELSWDAAQAAIDLVIKNACEIGLTDFQLGFHGGGEPTLAWDLLRRCADYALEEGQKRNLQARIYTASNGMLKQAQREYIGKYFTSINVSMDGPPDIQDQHRPRTDGSGSAAEVMETLKYFEEIGFHFSIRATVTSGSVHRMSEMAAFFKSEFPSLEQLHVEPVWYCGRCLSSGEGPPAGSEFARAFIAACETANRLGLRLTYSGARLDTLSNRFCAAPGGGFSVTPEGIASACFEVIESSDPRAEIFHYGYYDTASNTYIFDEERQKRLRGLSVDNIRYCRDCFCKWHCAGDCLAKAIHFEEERLHRGSDRCQINREITLHHLKDMVTGYANKPISID
ncbi:MAG: radical SAM protein [Methanobacterium sp.]